MDREALFLRDGEQLVPTLLTRGPWDPEADSPAATDGGFLHGGAVCGLAGWALEREAASSGAKVLTRLTVELWHAVLVEPLVVTTAVARPGRRVAVIDAHVHQAGRVVARATSQWAAADPGQPEPGEPEPGAPLLPDRTVARSLGDWRYPRPGFNCDAVELRPLHGSTEQPGPGVIWVRVRHPVVAGDPLTPVQRAATLADFGLAVGWDWGPAGNAFINPDVTLQLLRYPLGEWLCLDSRMSVGDGVGLCETVLWDGHGRVGRVLQSQVPSPHRLPTEHGG